MTIRSKLRQLLLRRLPSFLSGTQTEVADPADLYFAYRLLLGRPPEPGGWRHWSEHLRSGMTLNQLVSAFLSSLEFRRRYRFRPMTRVQADGFAIFVDENDHAVSSTIIATRMYEPHVTKALRSALKPDSVFLDVGCSIGWFVLLAAALSPRGKVIGIEPNHNNLQVLYRSIAANGFENIVVFPYAATDISTLLQLGFDAAYGFVHGIDDASEDSLVQGKSVDELVAGEGRIDVVKIDIEGHEPVALRGMQKTVARHRPLLLTEFHPKLIRDHAGCDPVEYLEALFDLGYSLSVLTHEGEEVPQKSASEIMLSWRSLNEQKQTEDTLHLDLVGRF